MATFLQLCQKLSRESGSVSGGATLPVSVSGQSGRLAKLVGWIADSWVDIQNDRNDWNFLQKKLSSSLIVNNLEYTGVSFGLSDVSKWKTLPRTWSIYDPAIGQADESFLRPVEYDAFYSKFLIGTHDAQRPGYVAVSPLGELCFGPKPDKSYMLRGWYRRTPQVLAANADVPIVPDMHDMIVWRAMKRLDGSDEAPTRFQFDSAIYENMWANFVRAYTPKIGGLHGTGGETLA